MTPTTEILIPVSPKPPAVPAVASIDLHAAVLAGQKARTARAYRSAYDDFARFLGLATATIALASLVSWTQPMATSCVLAYRAHLVARQLSPATIAQRLSALRSAVRLGRQLGLCPWTLEVESPRVESYRDTRGPGRDGWHALLAAAIARATTPRGRRDLALVRLLHDLGLRRDEAAALDLAHVELDRSAVQVLGKGKSARVPLTLPPATRAALADWIAARGPEPGPLLTRLTAARGTDPHGRLTGDGIRKIVASLGRAAKLARPVRPHGLRHQAITTALDRTGGDVRAVRKFSRHSKLETLMVYDDNRRDLAGDVAALVAAD